MLGAKTLSCTHPIVTLSFVYSMLNTIFLAITEETWPSVSRLRPVLFCAPVLAQVSQLYFAAQVAILGSAADALADSASLLCICTARKLLGLGCSKGQL